MTIKNNILSLALVIAFSAWSYAQEYRAFDGTNNNLVISEWGSAGGPVLFDVPPAFLDGISTPARTNMMNPRRVSNMLFHQIISEQDYLGLSDFSWAFGQFVDHDITLVENFNPMTHPQENVSIVVPAEDTMMTPGKLIPVMRSIARQGTGTDVNNPRGYSNEITAFLDASAVYGSDQDRASWLRTFEGGKLKTSKGNLLPWNTIDGEFSSSVDPRAPHMADDVGLSTRLFVAGDVRANENPMLLTLHLLFVREHNRLCETWLTENPALDPRDAQTDEWLYQRARKVVGGILQHIVYQEWLPTLGVQLSEYNGYNEQVNPSITNTFSAASFRWGHTMINEQILRYDMEGRVAQSGHISLSDAFFNPLESLRQDPEFYLKGMGVQVQQRRDCKLVNSVRNFLFGQNPILGGLDLAAINIQRGRERGIPDYNTLRSYYGLQKVNSFEEICVDNGVTGLLEEIYHSVDSIDPWVAMLAEDALEGSIFGEMLELSIREQFVALRDGDRFFYLNDDDLEQEDRDIIFSSTLSELIMRNTDIICFQDNAFQATEHNLIPCFPEVLPTDLDMSLAPNPVVAETFLSVFSTKSAKAHLRIVNEAGQEMKAWDYTLTSGVNELMIDMSDLTVKGPYYLILERQDDLRAIKVLKL